MAHIEKDFTVPGYYSSFVCKADRCRHTCCDGLDIRISQEEYFRLAGLSCPEDLRSALDVSLHVLPHPDEYAYACLSPDFFGRCRMMDEKGLCALQKTCGYEVLTSVCRYFPRSPKLKKEPECSISNACEETLELLRKQDFVWSLEKRHLAFDLAGEEPADTDPDSHVKTGIHRFAVSLMTKKGISLSGRLGLIRYVCRSLLPMEESSLFWTSYRIDHFLEEEKRRALCQYPVSVSPSLLSRLIRSAGEAHPDLAPCTEGALQVCEEKQLITGSFLDGILREMDRISKDFSSFLSDVLTNELFYVYFPFPDGLSMDSASDVLAVIAAMILVMISGNRDALRTEDAQTDFLAAFFRMADLTDFWRSVHAAMQEDDGSTPAPAAV